MDFVRLPNSIELNPRIEFDWVRLSSIFERSIYYAGIHGEIFEIQNPKMKEAICFLSTLLSMGEWSHSCCDVGNCQYQYNICFFSTLEFSLFRLAYCMTRFIEVWNRRPLLMFAYSIGEHQQGSSVKVINLSWLIYLSLIHIWRCRRAI